MKPEKFIGIMLITLLLSCEMEEQVDQKIGEVSFKTNQYIMNSSFDVDIYIDQTMVGSINKNKDVPKAKSISKFEFNKKLEAGVHNYEVKIYSYNGDPSKTIKGKFIIKEKQKNEIFIDFRNYNRWI